MSSQEEHEIQKNAISHLYVWFRIFHPELCMRMEQGKDKNIIYKPALYSIPNGAKRGKRLGPYMVAEGLLSGVSDLFLALPRKGYHGLYIEVKVPKRGSRPAGQPFYNQKQFMKYAEDQGYAVAICRSTQEIIDTVQKYVD